MWSVFELLNLKSSEKNRQRVLPATEVDPLAPARGVLHGVWIMAAVWITVALLVGAFLLL